MWRVGHVTNPLDFVPFRFCSWAHRFDHPCPHPPSFPIYRTLYCAEQRVTCFREILDRFTPSVKTAREISKVFRQPLHEILAGMGKISIDFFLDKSIAGGRIRILAGSLVDLDDPGIRRGLEVQYPELFEEIDRLDISAARSRRRIMTRELGRSLFEEGAAGIIYGSNIDDQRCFALFEMRAELEALTMPEPLAGLLHEIEPVLLELGLAISRS